MKVIENCPCDKKSFPCKALVFDKKELNKPQHSFHWLGKFFWKKEV
jgi:hypothetical protein